MFSEEEIPAFFRELKGKRPTEYRFTPNLYTAEYVLNALLYACNVAWETGTTKRIEKPDVFSLKGALYALGADFIKTQKFEEIPSAETSLVFQCIAYIEANYTSDISLKSMAKNCGYSHEYVSRVFHGTFRLSFKKFVNQYRCERARDFILSTDKSLSEIAYESGFQSIRSFNRVFKELTGSFPSDIKE